MCCSQSRTYKHITNFMGWALLWAFIIAGISTSDVNGSGVFVISFLVIWYFADKANGIAKLGQRMIDERQNRIDALEITNTPPKQKWDDVDTDREILREETERIGKM